ncbi:MAG TPA: peptidylprolyl isomerase [Bacteroidales bacterium]|nr:peptidylprolyl isomerase [Bacteroidales bacterium]
MNNYIKRIFSLNILLLFISCTAPGNNENTTISIETSLGAIKVLLYDDTPIHRDNFIKLVKSGAYEDVTFHRIIKDFMIQGGDPATKTIKQGIPDTLSTYTIPAEFRSNHFHKKGALAAARQGNEVNPEMRSSGTQFYIVQGTKLTSEQISSMEQRINNTLKQAYFNNLLVEVSDSVTSAGVTLSTGKIQEIASIKMYKYLETYKDFSIPEEQRTAYMNIGGTPFLDGTYTVFGEVVEGLDIVDKIADVQTGPGDRPVNDVRILKMSISKK